MVLSLDLTSRHCGRPLYQLWFGFQARRLARNGGLVVSLQHPVKPIHRRNFTSTVARDGRTNNASREARSSGIANLIRPACFSSCRCSCCVPVVRRLGQDCLPEAESPPLDGAASRLVSAARDSYASHATGIATFGSDQIFEVFHRPAVEVGVREDWARFTRKVAHLEKFSPFSASNAE